MSVQEALAFITLAGRDRRLREEMNKLKGAKAIDGLVELGRRKGLEFSVEEYRNAVVLSADGELDDTALEEVLREVGMSSPDEHDLKDDNCGCEGDCDCFRD